MIHAFSGFSGAGAVLLGEWLGWHHAGACDRDPFCRAVIAHHLPAVPLFDDMSAVPWESAWSDCSPEDGLASRTASPATDSGQTTSATDGDLLSTPFAVVDQNSRSWKTSQQSFLATPADTGLAASLTCPASGTMRNGWCWERTLPAPTTAGDACGSSRGGETWPTPCATDSESAANRTAWRSDPDSKHHSGTTLTDAIRLWPTPTGFDSRGETDPKLWSARRDRAIARLGPDGAMGMPLRIALRSWPPPTRAAAESQGTHGNGAPTLCSAAVPKGAGLLNPAWVEALMGWPARWTGLPAEAIARLRQEKRSTNGKRRARAAATPAAPTRSEPSATDGTSRARSSRGGRSPGAPASGSNEGAA